VNDIFLGKISARGASFKTTRKKNQFM